MPKGKIEPIWMLTQSTVQTGVFQFDGGTPIRAAIVTLKLGLNQTVGEPQTLEVPPFCIAPQSLPELIRLLQKIEAGISEGNDELSAHLTPNSLQ